MIFIEHRFTPTPFSPVPCPHPLQNKIPCQAAEPTRDQPRVFPNKASHTEQNKIDDIVDNRQ